MSHVVLNNNAKGKILSIEALKRGCNMLTVDGVSGLLELVPTEKGKGHYRTWKDDHGGRLVGDWDVPAGMTSDSVGENADFVIRATEAGRKYLRGRGYPKPYEVGVVWSEADQCHRLVYDFFGKAAGLELLIGDTKVDYTSRRRGQLATSCPRLIQMYNVARDGCMSELSGDVHAVVPQADGSFIVGEKGDKLLLPDGTEITLGAGDVVGEIAVDARVGLGAGIGGGL